MSEDRADARAAGEPLHGTSGRLTGISMLVIVVVVVLLGLVEPSLAPADWFLALLALVAVLAWAASLRPGVVLERDHVVLRNMYETVRVPLLAVRSIEVRSLLEVRTAAKTFVSPAIGRSRRQLSGRGRRGFGGLTHILGKGQAVQTPDVETTYGDFVEQRILARVADCRARAGLPDRTGWADRAGRPDQATDDEPAPPPAERIPAWPEIVATVLAVLALVVTALT